MKRIALYIFSFVLVLSTISLLKTQVFAAAMVSNSCISETATTIEPPPSDSTAATTCKPGICCNKDVRCNCGCKWILGNTADGTSCTDYCAGECADTTGGTGGAAGGGTTPPAACSGQTFVKASVAPASLRPFDQVTVKCNYGKRLDCLSVTGAGLTNCRYSRYEGTDNIFTCDAGPNAGFYDDAKCVLNTGTADACCKADNKAGDMNIIGTEVHYDQDIVLPFGKYTLGGRVFSVISKGKGVRIVVICNSDTCTSSINKNGEVGSLSFPESTDFVDKTQSITIVGTGDDRHYLVRVSVDKGSEAYFDSVSLKNSAQKELAVNGDFSNATNGSVTTKQPTYWGEGDNKIGYYYGSVAGEEASTDPPGTTTTGTTTVTGTFGTPASVTLNLKIKLQGISKKPANANAINVRVKLAGGGLSKATDYKTASFTVDDVGVWTGTVAFDAIPTGGGYRVYIKGPKHLAKKICDATPSESKGGTYHCSDGKISLVAGTNTLNFSGIIQLAGDLPEVAAQNGTQNGIIDAYDTTFVRTNLGVTDAAKLTVGDLNLDNIIDTQDYSTILQSLSIKFDEE